jgi:hypothetical protein
MSVLRGYLFWLALFLDLILSLKKDLFKLVFTDGHRSRGMAKFMLVFKGVNDVLVQDLFCSRRWQYRFLGNNSNYRFLSVFRHHGSGYGRDLWWSSYIQRSAQLSTTTIQELYRIAQ